MERKTAGLEKKIRFSVGEKEGKRVTSSFTKNRMKPKLIEFSVSDESARDLSLKVMSGSEMN